MAMQVHSGKEIMPKGSTPEVGCTNVTNDRRTDLRQQRPERNESGSGKNVG